MKLISVYRVLVWVVVYFLVGCTTAKYIPAPGSFSASGLDQIPIEMKLASDAIIQGIANETLADQVFAKDIEAASQRELQGWAYLSDSSLAPILDVSIEHADRSVNWGQFTLYLLTLTLVPSSWDDEFTSVVTVSASGKELYRNSLTETVRTYLSVYFPTPYLVGDSDSKPFVKMAKSAMNRQQANLSKWVNVELSAFNQAIEGKSGLDQQLWLRQNQNTLFRTTILKNLAADKTSNDLLKWHLDNSNFFPDYLPFIPEEYQMWYAGPVGNRVIEVLQQVQRGDDVSILASRLKVSGDTYRIFSNEEIAMLKEKGLPSVLISAMLESGSYHNTSPVKKVASNSVQPAKQNASARYAIFDNSGEFMCPWTTDDVLAEWVDKSINASIGSSVGATVGAYAGQKLLGTIPFVGGWLGSKVGNETGRMIAIEASGGEAYIRETSDISFRTLEDMARYIQANYVTNSHYQDGIDAASQIYPDLMEAMGSLY